MPPAESSRSRTPLPAYAVTSRLNTARLSGFVLRHRPTGAAPRKRPPKARSYVADAGDGTYGMMIAIRCCFAGACARAGPVAAARNRPVMKSRRLVKPTFPGFRAVAGPGLFLGGVLGNGKSRSIWGKTRSSGARTTRSCTRIAADEKRNSMASFRLFAGSELSLGSCQRDLGVLGNHPAVQNMLLAPRALGLGATLYLQFEKEAEAALGLPPRRPFLCSAADRLPNGSVRISPPCSAGRCRLRRPMGPALPGSVAIWLRSPANAYLAGQIGSHR
jgi:hypothetical protein